LLKKAVSKIERNEAGLFVLESADGESFTTKNLLVASGSNRKIWDLLSEMGLSIVEPVPSLFSFNIRDRRIQDLSGRSFKDVEISCSVGKESFSTRGPLLITHWGLSGPAILKLSAWAARALATVNYSTTLKINFLPEVNRQTLSDRFRELRTSEAKKKIKNYLLKGMNSNYWDAVLSYLNFPKEMMWAEVSNHQLEKLADEVLRAEFKTEGKTTNKDEFVTAGGVSLKEIDFKTMMAKKIPHLYFAGEVLNIDGITGGFNFQSAWSTSAVAAKAAITLENGSGSD
jgi:predicted Rossmann fold flavoprotein